MTTQILDPTHLSMSSERDVSEKLNAKALDDAPSGSNCEAIFVFLEIGLMAVKKVISKDRRNIHNTCATSPTPERNKASLDSCHEACPEEKG